MNNYRATAALAVLSDVVLELIERDAEPLVIRRTFPFTTKLEERLYIPARHGLWAVVPLEVGVKPDVWLVNRQFVRNLWTDGGMLVPAERPLSRVIKAIASEPATEYIARQRSNVGLDEPSHTRRFELMVRDRGNLPAEWDAAFCAVMHILMPVAV